MYSSSVLMTTDALDARGQMLLALAAYATYVINATQFILKLRAARLDQAQRDSQMANRSLAT